eukprot:jgi/Mesvir1/2144/Mv16665-RA.1
MPGDEEDGKGVKKTTRRRLLEEMLGSVRGGSSTEWKVLIMDYATVKIMSAACKMADIADEGIALTEDLFKRREPQPHMDAVYFLTPDAKSIAKLREDFTGKTKLYRRAHIFFSSPIPRHLLNSIRGDAELVQHLAGLKELNLEYLAIDRQAFLTHRESETLMDCIYGNTRSAVDFQEAVDSIATRIATVLVSLNEVPAVRYRQGKLPPGKEPTDLPKGVKVAQAVAQSVHEKMVAYQRTVMSLPNTSTCDLIIVDRALDPVAPVIHEWTYGAMVYDLLAIKGNVYKYQMETNAGKLENTEVILDDNDPLWVELYDMHIAQASVTLSERMAKFKAGNKAAQMKLGGDKGGGSGTRDLRAMVQSLPQYRNQLAKLGVHIDIASKLNSMVKEMGLDEIGSLEQDLVYGDATSKELISFFNTRPSMAVDDKVRLLMIYAATHPEKLDATKRIQWMKLTKVSGDEFNAVNNLECIGVPVSKTSSSGGFSLSFGKRKKRVIRKEKEGEQSNWNLARFQPYLQEVVEDLVKGDLSAEEFPFVGGAVKSVVNMSGGHSAPTPPTGSGASARTSTSGGVKSARTKGSWANKGKSTDDGDDGGRPSRHTDGSRVSSSHSKRIIVFVLGGMAYSEIRSAHQLKASTGHEVIVGSNIMYAPKDFMEMLRKLSPLELCFRFGTLFCRLAVGSGFSPASLDPLQHFKPLIKLEADFPPDFGLDRTHSLAVPRGLFVPDYQVRFPEWSHADLQTCGLDSRLTLTCTYLVPSGTGRTRRSTSEMVRKSGVCGDDMTMPQWEALRAEIDDLTATILSIINDADAVDARRRIQAAVLSNWAQRGEGDHPAGSLVETVLNEFCTLGYVRVGWAGAQASRDGADGAIKPLTPDACYAELAQRLLLDDFRWASTSQLRQALESHGGWYPDAYLAVSRELVRMQALARGGGGQGGEAMGGPSASGPEERGLGPHGGVASGSSDSVPAWAAPSGLLKISHGRARRKVDISSCPALQFDLCSVRQWQEAEAVRRLADMWQQEGATQRARVDCGCCYSDHPIEQMVQCQDAHLFCKACVKRYVENVLFGTTRAERGLPCMSTDGACDAFIAPAQLMRALPAQLLDKFERKCVADSVQRAQLPGLTRCHACDFAAELDDDSDVLDCPMCGEETCKACGEVAHHPLACDEVEDQGENDDQASVRIRIEEQMTRKMVRECAACKTKLEKDGGCNKITCRCGEWTCYVCRQSIPKDVSYDHFCQHALDPGKGCSECQRCLLWQDTTQIEETELRRFQEESVRAAAAQDPSLAHRPIGPDLAGLSV